MPTDKPKNKALKGSIKSSPRVQFLAAESEIDILIEQGYSWRAIHRAFKDSGKFTMSYASFCNYMNGNSQLRAKPRKKSKKHLPQIILNEDSPTGHKQTSKGPVVIQQPKDDAFSDKTPTDKDNLV